MKLSRHWRTILGAAPLLLLLPSASPATAAASPASGCSLPSKAGVKHVIDIQFDNVHLRRDTPNVPSDLEQMPNLLNFLQGGGALLDDHHTPLIAHTADDILTTNTGLYGDQQGQPVANSYREFTSPGKTVSSGSFAYWTDTTPDGTFNMLSGAGANAPAPWVPFTRAGCNFGSIATANSAFESLGDVARVYGPNSPQAQEVSSGSPNAFADFEGIAIHCARGAALCSKANTGIADVLPAEPGGYTGFNGLFGHKYVGPQISSNGPLLDLDGNLIADSFNGHVSPGFPGFDGMSAAVSLAYTAAMQEHGVPITYSYISSAHVDANGNDAGPGQADYVARLRAYDEAWGKFFARLQADGINRSNTLFIVTSDENDHFAGGQGAPAGCDGVQTPCTYAAVGEVHADLTQLLQQAGSTTPFTQHSDSSPAIYLTGQPARDGAVTRTFDRTLANIEVTNPLNGRVQPLFNFLTDSVGMKLLHMVSADPNRTPTVVAWGNPDYFVDSGTADCPGGPVVECPPSFGEDAWIHGTISPDINHTWLGLVGPGVRQLGRNETIWSDHADVRPTIMLLTGLRDDYQDAGRPLFEALTSRALPDSVRDHESELIRLAQTFKRIDAPVGQLSLDGVRISTAALSSGSASDDSRYAQLESQLAQITTQRDALASKMNAMISAAAFHGRAIDQDRAENLVSQGRDLLDRVTDLANDQR
jgi:hypothetical protein